MQEHRPTRSFSRSVLGTYGTLVAMSILSLVSVLVVARALGPVGRGDIAFLTTVATLTNYVVNLGVHEAISNQVGREPESRPSLATNAVALALALGVGAAASVLGLVSAFPAVGGDVERPLLWAAVATIPVLMLGHFLSRLVTADYRFAVANVAMLITPSLIVVVNVTLWLAGELTVGRALLAWIAAQCAATLFLALFVATRLAGFGRPSLRLARRTVGFGLKTHGGAVMMMGNYRIDQWLLGSIAGSRELGLYSIAVAWTEGLFHVSRALSLVARPDLVRATRERAAELAARILRVGILVTLPLVAGMVVFAPFLCTSVFGDRFAGSIDDLRVLALGAFGVVAFGVLGPSLIAQARPLLQSSAIGFGFLVTLVANVVLIPPLGGLGAAIASTVAYTLTGLLLALFLVRALGGRTADLYPRRADVTFIVRRLRAASRRAS